MAKVQQARAAIERIDMVEPFQYAELATPRPANPLTPPAHADEPLIELGYTKGAARLFQTNGSTPLFKQNL